MKAYLTLFLTAVESRLTVAGAVMKARMQRLRRVNGRLTGAGFFRDAVSIKIAATMEKGWAARWKPALWSRASDVWQDSA